MLAPIHPHQKERLAAIRRYDLGTQAHGGAFDGIVELAAQMSNCPIALVSIVHADDQKFEAVCGLDFHGTNLESSMCSHAILQEEILEIPDTRVDIRTRDNPLVTGPDPILFYAGAQITTKAGIPLGSLCVLDRRPRRLGDAERRALRILADQVMQRLELHEALRQQDAMRREVDHRVKNSLANVAAMTRMAARSATPEVREAMLSVEKRISVMVELHNDLYRSDNPDEPIEVTNYLERVASHLRDMSPPGVEIEVHFDAVALIARRASALGVLINEMISNACKHAFPDGRTGRIVLSGQKTSAGRYAIACADDGVGAVDASESGLGQRIMEASAAQLEGLLRTFPSPDGYRTEIEFPVTVD
tara:strand:+ start:103 stop:1188 length:1086 start_codon:yes stop_codon:yes gene_type:complete